MKAVFFTDVNLTVLFFSSLTGNNLLYSTSHCCTGETRIKEINISAKLSFK